MRLTYGIFILAGVISGALLQIRDDFHLSDWEQELVVSVTTAGAVVGSLLGGPGNQRFGRRPIILLSSVIFTLGALVMGAASTFEVSPQSAVYRECLLCDRLGGPCGRCWCWAG
jgi:MFS family permease